MMLNVVFPQESGSGSRCWAAQARSLSQVETGHILEVSTVERQCGHQTPDTKHWTLDLDTDQGRLRDENIYYAANVLAAEHHIAGALCVNCIN